MPTPTPRVFRITDNPQFAAYRWITNYEVYRQIRGDNLQDLLDELAVSGGTSAIAGWTTAEARALAGIFVADPAHAIPGVSPDRPIP